MPNKRTLKIKNHCHICNEPITGNIRPAEEAGVKCAKCCAGEAEYVKNHPDEYPIPQPAPKKKKLASRNSKWDGKRSGTTLKDC